MWMDGTAFGHGMGVWDGVSVLKKHREVWDASMALLREIDPNYHCTSIGFNKNFKVRLVVGPQS